MAHKALSVGSEKQQGTVIWNDPREAQERINL